MHSFEKLLDPRLDIINSVLLILMSINRQHPQFVFMPLRYCSSVIFILGHNLQNLILRGYMCRRMINKITIWQLGITTKLQFRSTIDVNNKNLSLLKIHTSKRYIAQLWNKFCCALSAMIRSLYIK